MKFTLNIKVGLFLNREGKNWFCDLDPTKHHDRLNYYYQILALRKKNLYSYRILFLNNYLKVEATQFWNSTEVSICFYLPLILANE